MNDLESIKSKIILSKEIGKFLKLQKKGKLFWGVCPFHKEKTPSFSVNDSKNFFYCFGCGSGGDFFTFMQKYKNMPFAAVVESLGIKTNSYIHHHPYTHLYNIVEQAKNIYKNNISKCISYLNERGLQKFWIEKFELGFAEESNTVIKLMEMGHSMESIKESGIIAYAYKDRFRNRIIFPIKDKQKKTISFGGRTIENEEPKYLNGPETPIFDKSIHCYGEDLLEWGQPVIIVEGYLDVIGLYQCGFSNIIGVMGTSLSKENIYSVFKYTNKVFIMFDGDLAGKNAVKRNLENILCCLQPDREVLICQLNNEDPFDCAKKGNFYVKEKLSSSIQLSQWIKNEFFKVQNTPEEYASNLLQLNSIIDNIENIFVKKAFKSFFYKRVVQKEITKEYSKEDEIIGLFVILHEFWNLLTEDFMCIEFSDEKNRKLKEVILNKVENNDYDGLIEYKEIKKLILNTKVKQFLFDKQTAIKYFLDSCKLLLN